MSRFINYHWLKTISEKAEIYFRWKSPFVSFNVSGRRRRWLKFGVQLRSADFRKVCNFEQGATFINPNKTKLQLRLKWNIDKTSLKKLFFLCLKVLWERTWKGGRTYQRGRWVFNVYIWGQNHIRLRPNWNTEKSSLKKIFNLMSKRLSKWNRMQRWDVLLTFIDAITSTK